MHQTAFGLIAKGKIPMHQTVGNKPFKAEKHLKTDLINRLIKVCDETSSQCRLLLF